MLKPKKINPPAEKINPKQIRQTYLDSIEDSFTKDGVVFFEGNNLRISDDYLYLPHMITDVSSKDLGEYLNAFTQQKMYMRTLLGRVEIMLEDSRRKYHEACEPIYKKYSETKMTETAKERLLNSDPTVKPLYHTYMDYKQKQSLLEYNISNIEDAIFMLSREVSRRGGDFSDENRAINVNSRRK